MRIVVQVRRACIALALTLVVVPALAQTTGVAPTASGIGLTADHKRIIYREIGHEPARPLADASQVSIGAEVPDSLILNEMPVSVKDQIGVLRDFKFAKLPDERIIIVDPAQRRIVDIVTKGEGAR